MSTISSISRDECRLMASSHVAHDFHVEYMVITAYNAVVVGHATIA